MTPNFFFVCERHARGNLEILRRYPFSRHPPDVLGAVWARLREVHTRGKARPSKVPEAPATLTTHTPLIKGVWVVRGSYF